MSSRMCNMTFSMKPTVAASGTVEESVSTDDIATDSAVTVATVEVEPETAPEAEGNTVPAANDGPVIEIVIPEVKDAPKKASSTKEPSSKGGRRVVITEGE